MNRLHATKDFWLAALRADGPAFQDAVAPAYAQAARAGYKAGLSGTRPMPGISLGTMPDSGRPNPIK